jgi:hypothetical protein
MLLTMSLVSDEGDHWLVESDAILARASIGLTLTLLFSCENDDRLEIDIPRDLFISYY